MIIIKGKENGSGRVNPNSEKLFKKEGLGQFAAPFKCP